MLGSYGNLITSIKKGAAWAKGHINKVPVRAGGKAGIGAIVGNMTGYGSFAGAAVGAASKPLGSIGRGIKHVVGANIDARPIKTGVALGLGLGTAGAAICLGTRTIRQLNTNMNPPDGVGASMTTNGYVSWTNGRSQGKQGMSAEHLAASGGLALSLHKTRHRLNLHRQGFV